MDQVLQNLKSDNSIWKQGWLMNGVPESAITGKRYRGANSFLLSLVAFANGYKDNRWLTYNQMKDKGWNFKTDAEGKSLGKGAGVPIEYYELRDRETKQPFNPRVLDGMTIEEREDYMKDNVYPIRKGYRVFNADIIDGIPEKEMPVIDTSGYSERAENLLQLWSDTEARIIHGGDSAYYNKKLDDIHLPEKDKFYSLQEYYATGFHEVGHSTGHPSRLNRDMGGGFGTESYAIEELRAEIASMFIEQELGIAVEEKHIQNNSAYIKAWIEHIEENPNVLFTAIADADKIARYVIAKEQQKTTQPYAIKEDTDEQGKPVYKLYVSNDSGQLTCVMSDTSKQAIIDEVKTMQVLPDYDGKELREVSMEELQEISVREYEEKVKKDDYRKQYEEQKSDVYIRPSEIAAMGLAVATGGATALAVDMAARGIESLTHLSDREIVEKAGNTKSGDKFNKLYNGESVLGSEEKDERSLMSRLAMFTGGNAEQLMRIFKSSGQYRDSKPNAYYESLAQEQIQFVASLKAQSAMVNSAVASKGHVGINAKR